jgi:fructose-bisphosphate aldolase class 1
MSDLASKIRERDEARARLAKMREAIDELASAAVVNESEASVQAAFASRLYAILDGPVEPR